MANRKRLKDLDPQIIAALNEDDLNRRKAAGEAALDERNTFVELEAGGDSALVDRLTCDPRMKKTRASLRRLAEELGDDLLALDILTLAVALPRQWERMSKVSTSLAREDLKEMSALARKLARKLKANRAEIQMLAGYDTDLPAVIVTELKARGREEQAAQVRKWDSDAILNDEKPAMPDFPEALDALADRLDVPDHQEPVGGRPTKPSEQHAARTYYVQQLAAFLHERTDDRIDRKLRNQIVAGLADAVFGSLSSRLTARHVQLLLKPN